VVMLLLLLAAGLLYSAQSAPHPALAASAVPAFAGDHEIHSPVVHDHQHGNEWSPPVGKRLRPQPPSALAAVHIPVFPLVVTAPTVPAADPPTASNSILRV
jgi:hypothetical protein